MSDVTLQLTVETVDVEVRPEIIDLEIHPEIIALELGASGPQGPAGPPPSAIVYQQATPLATWTITHNRGRVVDVTVYVDGQIALTDVSSTTSTTTITFAAPTSGYAVII